MHMSWGCASWLEGSLPLHYKSSRIIAVHMGVRNWLSGCSRGEVRNSIGQGLALVLQVIRVALSGSHGLCEAWHRL